jgi:hypothetical protein
MKFYDTKKEKKRRDGHHQLIRRLFHHISQDIIDRPSQIKKKKVHYTTEKYKQLFLVAAKKIKRAPPLEGSTRGPFGSFFFDPITILSRKRISQDP